MDALLAVTEEFGALMLTVLPWFAVGTLTAALIETFVPGAWAQRALGGRSGLPVAVAAGAVLPGCSCTTMPLAAGLSGLAGARVGILTAFVFVSPLLSPITVLLTLSLLGWEMTTARVLASLGGSLVIGMFINRYEAHFRPRRRLLPVAGGSPESDRCCAAACQPTAANRHQTAGEARAEHRQDPAEHRAVLPGGHAGRRRAVGAGAGGRRVRPTRGLQWRLGLRAGSCSRYPALRLRGRGSAADRRLLAAGLGPGPSLTFLLAPSAPASPRCSWHAASSASARPFYLAFWIAFAISVGATYQALMG
jgi:uncharacterized membrane protein YraQ (UPF0718 family)